MLFHSTKRIGRIVTDSALGIGRHQRCSFFFPHCNRLGKRFVIGFIEINAYLFHFVFACIGITIHGEIHHVVVAHCIEIEIYQAKHINLIGDIIVFLIKLLEIAAHLGEKFLDIERHEIASEHQFIVVDIPVEHKINSRLGVKHRGDAQLVAIAIHERDSLFHSFFESARGSRKLGSKKVAQRL